VNYQVDIDYQNVTESGEEITNITEIARRVISVTQGHESLSYRILPNADLASVWNPFPRSTVAIDNKQGSLYLYFIDRSFYLGLYSLYNYLDSTIEPGFLYQLNKTLING